jgi:cysteine synthase
MKNGYTVHSVAEGVIEVDAVTADGTKVKGTMAALIVELIPDEAFRKTITHVVPVADEEALAAASKLFQQDARVIGPSFKAAS